MQRWRFINFSSVGVKLFVILFCTIVLLSSVLGLTSYYAAKAIITDEWWQQPPHSLLSRRQTSWISCSLNMKRSPGNSL